MNSVERLNELTTAEAYAGFERCCGSTGWVGRMLAARPFADESSLVLAATDHWWDLEPSDWFEAFLHHPQIGADVESLRQKFTKTASLSESEQSGIVGASEATLQGLATRNQAYLEKFGYIFIVCATGKSAAEMLDILESRLPNDPADEIRVAAEQQRQITELRLRAWLQTLGE